MLTRRLSWLLAALCSLVFLAVYQKWLAWLVTGAVFLVPLFSLVISLPAMLTTKLILDLPGRVEQGQPLELCFFSKGPFPAPPWRCRIEVHQPLCAKQYRLRPGDLLLNRHCGEVRCQLKRMRICDYLGIFSLPIRGIREYRVLVMPKPVPISDRQVVSTEKIGTWKPKPGGLGENHELRLYRPGDSIRQIHWKLSAKTSKLILREPMVPDPGRMLVRLILRGEPEKLDRMLGRTLWLGQQLVEQGLPFQLQCLTGDGILSFPIADLPQLKAGMERLLSCKPADQTACLSQAETAFWQYEVGGEPDEA